MEEAVSTYDPDLIVCPYLTAKVPQTIFSNKYRPCLIVHPGVAGDRGASSIDWAIHDNKDTWGVTVLQADKEMDAGDVWCTDTFPLDNHSTKTSLYGGEVCDTGVNCVMESLRRFLLNMAPVPQLSHSELLGTTRRSMKHSDREINWGMSAEEASAVVRMSDTQPGAIGRPLQNLCNDMTPYRFFNAQIETGKQSREIQKKIASHKPGDLIGKRNGAILMKTNDENALWIGIMKKVKNISSSPVYFVIIYNVLM